MKHNGTSIMKNLTLKGSVGIKGINKPNDIRAVQVSLNQLLNLIPPTQKLAVDGKLSLRPENSSTIAAIKRFQQKFVGMVRPDGRIDVNGKTHRKINERLRKPGAHLATRPPSFLPWMVTANREIGQAEVAGKKANTKILEYFKASGFWGTDDSGASNAWCASFVAWVMKQSGYKPVAKAYRAKQWTIFGQKINAPVYGAIGIKSRKGGGHVAFVVGRSSDGKHLFMLGGNQEDRVQVKRYPLNVWHTFVFPRGYDTSTMTLPIYTKPAFNAGRED